MRWNCPVCYSNRTILMLSAGTLPLSVASLQATAEESVSLPRYPVSIVVCDNCTHLYNSDFDAGIDQYSKDGCTMYNGGAAWKDHIDYVAWRVNHIKSTQVVEVGAGDGSFLAKIEGDKVAYEPSDDAKKIREKGIKCHKQYFCPTEFVRPGSLVVMRHVLEHIASPAEFLSTMAAMATNRLSDIDLFIEVPCIENALRDIRLEDWTYEHPNHFTQLSLETCLDRSGWDLNSIIKTYNGEVLIAHAKIRPATNHVSSIVDRYLSQRFKLKDKKYVFWGGAGKSTVFLNMFATLDSRVVDSDSRKWGKFVPGLGLKIENPYIITSDDEVIITTNWRERDILDEIRKHRLKPKAVYTYKNGELHACI